VAYTNMNKESSRSHAVFSIYIENKSKTTGGKCKTKKSVFHLIDLAGSERQKMTDTFGERLKEAGKINKSLMQLGHVIKNLIEIAEGKPRHIHYRDSKLTHLLKDSLGGNSKTCIIANVSPANCNLQETISTLVFAQSAKLIKNKAIVNEEMTNDTAYKEEIKKLRDKYNSIKAENLYLMSIIEKNKSDSKVTTRGNDFSKTLDYVEEEIETIVSEMVSKEEQIKFLQNDNEFFKEKIQKIEIEMKLKEKELREIKEISKSVSQEHEIIKTQLREYVLKNAYLSQQITQSESMLEMKEYNLKKEIDNLKSSLEENKKIVESKDSIISSLNGDIKNYMQIINQKDLNLLEMKKEIDVLLKENAELKQEVLKYMNKEVSHENEIEMYKSFVESKNLEIKLQKEEFSEFKKKGKTLIDQYDNKMESLKLKANHWEEEYKKSRLEIKNLNTLVNELKRQCDNVEEKLSRTNEELNRINLDFDKLKGENYRLNDENYNIRKELLKKDEEIELLSDNKNVNSNKVSLLNKLKQENSKFKEEVNEMRKTIDFVEKSLNFKNVVNRGTGQKLTLIDYSTAMASKENELNECKRLLHNSIIRIKSVFENSNDEFTYTITDSMKNFIEGKSLEEKFVFYLEKLFNYQEV
jgi:kinesin family protein 15